jgi:type VI secretion system protein ImpC
MSNYFSLNREFSLKDYSYHLIMPKPISFGKLDLNIVASMEKAHEVPEPETPFRVLIMGDFSGRANRGVFEPAAALAEKRLRLVDRDNLDAVMAKLDVTIRLPVLGKGASPVTMRFKQLDDFHPDNLFERLEVFHALRETRHGLKDPATFQAIAAKLQSKEKAPEPSRNHQDVVKPIRNIEQQATGSFLDQVLQETEGKQYVAESHGSSDLDNFLQEIVTPHLVPDLEVEQQKMIAAVDTAVGELMRMILHQPDFQEIESAWRGVQFLVSRLETGAELKLYLLDISKAELAADVSATEDLCSTGIYKLLVEQTIETPGAEPWAVLAGNYTFEQTQRDAELLGRMVKIAAAAGAPFIAAASDRLLGCESLAHTPDPGSWKQAAGAEDSRAWEALRNLSEASYLGLAIPLFLLRLPYGADTDPAERFDFEEMAVSPDHNKYLWGNPMFACVYLVAQAFSEYGWDLRPGVIQDIEGLPLHVYKEQGESLTKPCAEVMLTERAAEAIMEKGVMPLLSYKNQDMIRLARFQSLAEPPTHLYGRWSDD